MVADVKGWWCVRYGDALACVEAPSAAAALRRSLDLHPLGDWTDDPRELLVFPQDAYARSDVLAKRRRLMEEWAAFVTGKGADVVRLHG